MAMMLIASLPSVLKTRPAMPGVPAIFSPTAATMATLRFTLMCSRSCWCTSSYSASRKRLFGARRVGGLHHEADAVLRGRLRNHQDIGVHRSARRENARGDVRHADDAGAGDGNHGDVARRRDGFHALRRGAHRCA